MNIKITIIALVIILVGGYLLLGANDADAPVVTDTQNSDNLLGEPVVSEIATSNVAYYGTSNGYLAKPVGEGPFPALVLIHEWWGLNNNIRNLADDFAEKGYIAIAVDLYDGEVGATPADAGQLAGAVRENVEEAFKNLNAAVAYIEALPEANEDAIASVGWCFGGQWAYEMAKNDLGVDASIMYYGRFMPEDDLSMMRADILGHFGEEDTSIAVDDVREFEAKLKTLEGDHAVFIYPNAGHAFANEDNENAYNEEAATLAWERTMEFLERELK